MDDPDALLAAHGTDVWQTICRILGGARDADDCFQDAFVQYLQLTHKDVVARPAGMLKRIAIRRAIDLLRHRREMRVRANALPDNLLSCGPLPAAILAEQDLSDRLRAALSEIDPAQAITFALTQFEDMSHADVAELLETTANNVGVLLHRAKAELRIRLAEFARASR